MIAKPDVGREDRCGVPEVILGLDKSPEDIETIAGAILEKNGHVMVSKISLEKFDSIKGSFSGYEVDYNVRGEVLVVRKDGTARKAAGSIGIVTAGTSDIGTAEEARVIASELGLSVITDYDVGVAGLHRLFPGLERMKDERVSCIIAIAGMDGALPSVVAGLVDVPVIGVPTSTGYGVSEKGRAALFTMLSSCAPVAVVNIDNGFGAAVIAYQIARGRERKDGC